MTTKKKPVKKNETKSIELVREAPMERKLSAKDFLAPVLNQAQMSLILNKTPEYAIKKRLGPKGRTLSYVKHGYVTDQLNKLFGFDWDLVSDPISNGAMFALQIEEYENPDVKARKVVPIIRNRYIAVAGHIDARVCKDKKVYTITKSGFGSALWNDNTEFGDALKSAQSDLLKSCAARLGVALDLYWDDMAEQNKHYEEQQAKQQKEQEQVIEGLVEDEEIKAPANGVQLIAQAQSVYGLDFAALTEILGQDFINSYKPEMWEKLVKSQEEK